MRRFYASPDSFEGNMVHLDEHESHHLFSVLRLKVDDEVDLFDGEGREFRCRVASAAKRIAALEILQRAEPSAPESPLTISLAAALMKGDKTDLCIQKAVELGVAAFVPLITSRTEKLPKNLEKQISRWHRIALDATKQCGRAKLMSVSEPIEFSEFISSVEGKCLFFSERGGGNMPATITDSITVIVGPEGGWEDEEIETARRDQSIELVTLGGRIMRAETAAIALTAIVQHRFGDLK